MIVSNDTLKLLIFKNYKEGKDFVLTSTELDNDDHLSEIIYWYIKIIEP